MIKELLIRINVTKNLGAKYIEFRLLDLLKAEKEDNKTGLNIQTRNE